MQHEGIHVRAEFCNNKWYPLDHQPADEVNVTADTVKLADNNRSRACLTAFAKLARVLHGCSEFGASVERVSALAGFYFTILGFDPVAVLSAEKSDSGLLGFQTKTAAALLGF
jgi:hypothetical protein